MPTFQEAYRDSEKGLLYIAPPGSGKTRQGLMATRGEHTTVISTASLKKNFDKEEVKAFGTLTERKGATYSAIARGKKLRPSKHLILDESHYIRNPYTKTFKGLRGQRLQFEKVLAMTATPTVNEPFDIGSQVNLIAGKDVVPSNRKDFYHLFYKDVNLTPTLKQRMIGVRSGTARVLRDPADVRFYMGKHIYKEPKGKFDALMPKRTEEIVKVLMGPDQMRVYKYIEGSIPRHLRSKIKSNLPPSKQESSQLNAYMQGLRQVSNTAAPFIKEGSSRFRKGLELVGYKKISIPDFGIVKPYELHYEGSYVGNMVVDESKRVWNTVILPRFQGMGAGKKMYGEVLKQEGTLMPGRTQSPQASRLWKGLRGRYNPTEKTRITLERGQGKIKASTGIVANPKSLIKKATYSTKLDRMVEDLQDELKNKGKTLVYSNYLGAGIDRYKQRLAHKGINYSELTGSMSKSERSEAIKRYNAPNNTNVFLITGAGSEGVNAPSTLVQLMNPQWNKSKLYQAASRGIRRGDDPNKTVRIKTYLSTIPKKKPIPGFNFTPKKAPRSVDEYLLQLSNRKQKENAQFLNALETR